MSGGFFRGTSTDQDTRFSNKQAKLLKSQKFAPELEHLVDMTKVKMDLMKPWIAARVTELLGFEDEVLINFIFGLLDGKEVNGKEIQISLTGFMEKNTRKFMKELWVLLLSAQLNASGVPQQFLDAKEEETRKMKVEADRITDEIRKKREKESRDMDQERVSKMDDRLEKITAETRRLSPWASNDHPFEIINSSKRNDVRGATSERPRSRSLSKSPRAQSRSVSSEKSPRRHSPTTRRRYSPHRSRSPARRSSLYYRRSRSPIRHRSPSPARRRLQSPRRKSRSPGHRRSLTPIRRRRTPSPGWRRRALSPVLRRRAPSPVRRRRAPSPVRRHRTPSPARHRRTPSPARHRRTPSPARHRRTPSPAWRHRTPSPVRGRTPSPVHKRKSSLAARQRSPFEAQLSPARRRSPSSVHTPSSVHRRSPSPIHTRALSPVRGRSVSPLHRKSLSPVLSRSPSSLRERSLSSRWRESSAISHRKLRSPSTSSEKSPLAAQRRSAQSAGRSPLRVRGRSMTPSEKSFSLKSSSPSPAGHISLSSSLRRSFRKGSPVAASKEKPRERPISPYKNPKKQVRSLTENKRTTLPNESPVRHVKDRVRHDDSPSAEKQGDVRPCHEVREREENTRDKRSENSSALGKHRDSQQKMDNQGAFPPSKAIGDRSTGSKGHLDGMEFRNIDQQRMREKSSVPGAHYERVDRVKSQKIDEDSGMKKQKSDQAGIGKSNDKSLQLSNSAKEDNQLRSKVVEELADLSVAVSDGGDTNVHGRKEKRSNKRSKRHGTESDDESYDSEAEDRKVAKRRRRAEKKLRKEERRRRREERRRKREERRAEKHKLRKTSASSPSDSGQYQGDADALDSPHANRKEIHSGKVEADPKQKKLEIELQLKALESFKAKKGIDC